jgi:glycosyltransferase involved in cell wall biosynthesis
MHYPNYSAPIFHSHPYVVTIHDLVLLRHTRYITLQRRLRTQAMVPLVARRARAVVTGTRAMQHEILQTLKLPASQVHVVADAVGDQFRPINDGDEREQIVSQHGIARPYILFVGTLEPRKNLRAAMQAYDRLRARCGIPHQFVVVGGRGWKFQPIFDVYNSLINKNSVRLLDYVPIAHMPALYSAADLFVSPSFYEGFGMPPVEAMRCGVPVVVSDIPAHREVEGDAAVFVDPRSVESIADGMYRVLDDARFAADLRERSLQRGAQFTIARMADEMLRVYKAILG